MDRERPRRLLRLELFVSSLRASSKYLLAALSNRYAPLAALDKNGLGLDHVRFLFLSDLWAVLAAVGRNKYIPLKGE